MWHENDQKWLMVHVFSAEISWNMCVLCVPPQHTDTHISSVIIDRNLIWLHWDKEGYISMVTTPQACKQTSLSVQLLSEVQHAQVVPAVKTRHQPLPAAAMGPEQLRRPPQEGRGVEGWLVKLWLAVTGLLRRTCRPGGLETSRYRK